MRLKLKLSHNEKPFITIPFQYNELIQGFIYKHLDKWLAKKIHDKGFKDPLTERRFKLFTFSRLIPEKKALIKDKNIILYGQVSLTIASPINDFIQSFTMNLLKAGSLIIGGEVLTLSSIEIEGIPAYKEKVFAKTISSLTVYSTLNTQDGRKKTYFYSPFEKEFEKLLIENLNKKLRTLYNKTVKGGSIKPYRVNSKNQRIIIYKNTIIKGWDGIFELNLPPELFQIAFDTGLGAKNSQGFGCIEIWESKIGNKSL